MLLVEYQTSVIARFRPASSVVKSSKSLRERRKMTKSAPPERTQMSARMRTNQAHANRRRSHHRSTNPSEIAISVEDIYQSAERERLNYSAAVRRQNLEYAQSQTQFFRQGSPISRPNTSASRHIMASHRETNTPYSTWSEPVMSRPSSIVPHPELRHLLETGEYSDEDYDDDDDMAQRTPMTVTFSTPNRDCCEVLGPQLCYECRKNRIRQVSRERSDYYFPTLDPTEDSLTTAAIVRKYLPNLSEQEVEDKLARGEIARPSLKKPPKHIEFSDEEDEVRPKVSTKKVTIALTEKDTKRKIMPKGSDLFFTNVRDLNYKIITGNQDRNLGFKAQPRKNTEKKVEQSSSHSYFPTFVSPRKVKMVQETNYKTYFEPPLIEKAKQDVEPQFFAGSTGEYTLPEKLPDELVFVDKDGNSVKASSSQTFTAKESASSEGRKKSLDTEDDVFHREKEKELQILKEDDEELETDTNALKLDLDKLDESAECDETLKSDVDSTELSNESTGNVKHDSTVSDKSSSKDDSGENETASQGS